MAEEMQPAPARQTCDEEQLVGIVRGLVGEVDPGGASVPVGLDSRLEADLGLDSLAVVELRSRMEEAFGVALPERILGGGTVGEWQAVLEAARDHAGPPGSASRAAVPGSRPIPVPPTVASVPAGTGTLLEALSWHVQVSPARPCIRLLDFAAEEPSLQEISYARLSAGAAAVGRRAETRRARPRGGGGDHAAHRARILRGVLGAFLAGGVPVPIYPPARRPQLEDHLRRQAGILRKRRAAVLITVAGATAARAAAALAGAGAAHGRRHHRGLAAAGAGGAGAARGGGPDIAHAAVHLGSTGDPKGVMLTPRQPAGQHPRHGPRLQAATRRTCS